LTASSPVRAAALIGEDPECVGRLDGRRLVLTEQVHLGEDDAMRLLSELRRVVRDLATELVVFGLPVERVDGNEEGQQSRALDVTQELQPQPLPLVCALDDARECRRRRKFGCR
jgi:hypothetical protein